MPRLRLLAILLPLLASGAAAPASADGTPLHAVVGEGLLLLEDSVGKRVTALQPGLHEIRVDDRSPIHNVHLEGPGVSRDSGLRFTGSTIWSVSLRVGVHSLVSDPQADELEHFFVVGSPPAPTLFASVTDSAITITGADGEAVSQLAPGDYAIRVRDGTPGESFRLLGPGVEEHTQRHTSREETWHVTLTDGVYRYFSDRSAKTLRGSFRVGAGTAPEPGTTLHAVTGSDFAISLVDDAFAPVTRLPEGAYTVVVDDLSPDHNFRLSGPGGEVGTEIEEQGRRTLSVRLTDGDYAFFCTPHTLTMLRTFDVVGQLQRLVATLTSGGKVSLTIPTARPGRAEITVRDRSQRLGLRLSGPGVQRSTGRRFTGSATWSVRLAAGTYRFTAGRQAKTLLVRA